MPLLRVDRLSADVVALDKDQCIEAGSQLHAAYATATPFPHIVIDDFIESGLLRDIVASWPEASNKRYYDRPQERLKYEWQPHELKSPLVRSFLNEMNAEPMVRFIEALTGIPLIVTDPYFSGAGLHEIRRGGHLGIHADFNVHRGMNVLRRVNLLIYLNDSWQPEYGGNLELWSKDMSEKQREIAPILGRAVVFNTDLDSFHGHPEPLGCPADQSRRSIALYYYTVPATDIADVPARTTTFQVRPHSSDVPDVQTKMLHFFQDWVPPALRRILKHKPKPPETGARRF